MTVRSVSDADDVRAIDHGALIDFTRRLVQTPSVVRVSEGATEASVAALVEDWMRDRGWSHFRQKVAPDRANIVAVIDSRRAGPTLALVGHSDVVTEGDHAAWTHDPFGGTVEDGRLWGRGSADMKGGLAAMLFAADAVAASSSWAGRIIVAVLVDEEGLMLGAKHFAESDVARSIDAALICEPEGGEVCLVQKGAMRLVFRIGGRMAHGAMPDHGVSPLPALGRLISSIAEAERELQAEHGQHEFLGQPFLTPTVAIAGSLDSINVVPGDAILAVDVRSTPGIDHATVLDSLNARCQRVSETTRCRIEIEILDDRPPTETPEENPLVEALVAAHRSRHGSPPPFGGVPGTTDGTILWRDAGIPVVIYGPGGKWIAHQANEYVETQELGDYAEVYRDTAMRFLRRSGGSL